MNDPYWQEDSLSLYLGDCREVMGQMPAESVSCVVTSPPFWGLRSYSCPPSLWGGSPSCDHRLEDAPVGGETYTGRQRWQHDGVSRQETPEAWEKTMSPGQSGASCSRCGAWRGQFGLEPNVDCLGWATGPKCGQCYLCHTLEVLAAIKRVLRKDGVVYWDIDDSRGSAASKSLCLIPQRIELAAQAAGWTVRSEIIIPSWMPESAKDRPTDAYRKVLMLTKTKRYWYDAQAVRVPAAYAGQLKVMTERSLSAGQAAAIGIIGTGNARVGSQIEVKDIRNLGNLWDDIPSAQYPGAHFATFPVEEPLRCILSSVPPVVCADCNYAVPPGIIHSSDGQVFRNLPAVRESLRGGGARILQRSMYDSSIAREDTLSSASLRNMRQAIPSKDYRERPQGENLQPGMRDETTEADRQPGRIQINERTPDVEGRTIYNPRGVCDGEGREGSSDGPQEPLSPRTSISNGQEARTGSGSIGASSSPKRGQTGQSPRQSRTMDTKSTTRAASQRATTPLPDVPLCPKCSSPNLIPGIVLDPFVGTGTTLIAARKLGRRAIGIDANDDYLKQTVRRLALGDAALRRTVVAKRGGMQQGALW